MATYVFDWVKHMVGTGKKCWVPFSMPFLTILFEILYIQGGSKSRLIDTWFTFVFVIYWSNDILRYFDRALYL